MDVFSARRSIVVAATLFSLVGCSSAQTTPGAIPTPIPPPPVVLRSLPINAPIPTTKAIFDALSPLIESPALGDHVGVAVADALTGAMIYESPSTGDRFIPASSVKLFTATAVLLKDNPEEIVKFKGKNLSLNNLVEITLTESDNSGANLLSTLIPGSLSSEFASSLPTLDLKGTTLADASGLSRKNRTTPVTLVHLLTLIANLPQLSPILSGLPISGLSGTLKSRAVAVSGRIRAKTGTLTGVDVLAGYLVDRAKRALIFVVMADHVPKTGLARKKIDEIATALLNLG